MKKMTAHQVLVAGMVAAMWVVSGCGIQSQITPDMAGVSTAALATKVMFDDAPVETTPCHFSLGEKRHQVIIRMPGYEAYSVHLEGAARVWKVGGTIVGDFVCLAVDAERGGVYKLSRQEYLNAYQHEAVVMMPREHTLSVISVFKPNPRWTRIAELSRSQMVVSR